MSFHRFACTLIAATLAGCAGGRASPSAVQPAAPAIPPGPGASLKCQSSGKNAWETYGTATFIKVNKSIGAKALDPANWAGLGDPSRVGSGDVPATRDDPPTFEGKLAAYLVYAYGGPASITYADGKTYGGPQDMNSAHEGLGITPEQYRYFIDKIFVPALVENGVAAGGARAGAEGAGANDVQSCFVPLVEDPAFIASIVAR